MSEEIKNIMNNIENKWKNYYVQDIISNEELKNLHDFVKQVLEVNKTYNKILLGDTESYINGFEYGKEKMKEIIKNKKIKNKFIVIKDIIINISEIASIKYIKDEKVLYIRLRNIELPIRIEEVFNMDYKILLSKIEGE